MKRVFLSICVLSLVSACSTGLPDFSFLKFWGNDEEVAKKSVAVVDPTRLLFDLTEARLEPDREGAILRATGVAPTQGYHSGRLVLVAQSGSVATFQLRAIAPTVSTRQGSARTRQILVARHLDFSELQGIRTIEVITASRRIVLRNR